MNPYTAQETHSRFPDQSKEVAFRNAPLLGWCSMTSNGAHGPPIWDPPTGGSTSAWVHEYQSCPAPFNPIYRRDLGWNTRRLIEATEFDQRIDPGDYYIIRAADPGVSEGDTN